MQRHLRSLLSLSAVLLLAGMGADALAAQGTRLLRQPTMSADHIAFCYGGDLWIVDRGGGGARRLTNTPAVESNPHLSPDGSTVAFTSTRSGSASVYILPVEGGQPTRLTWHPSAAQARGWTPDGSRVLYSSDRGTAPRGYDRLWTVSRDGGASALLPAPFGQKGSFSSDGDRIVVDQVSRWDVEWRNYRGGQNRPLIVLDLDDLSEVTIPNDRTTDTHPVWIGNTIFFLSDRDFATNVWAYEIGSGSPRQITRFVDADVKYLTGDSSGLVLEQDGWIHVLDPATGQTDRLNIVAAGDFPWATARWKGVNASIASASLSPTGKRALMEARGDIFTVPVEKGDPRNLTRSSGVADRAPIWSPDGTEIAWFSDSENTYSLKIGPQDGLTAPRTLSLDGAKMAWVPAWSPDGTRIAFVDDLARLRIIELDNGRVTIADTDGQTLDRAAMAPRWSPDSKWLAYSKTYPNQFHRIVVWSVETGATRELTDALADAIDPAWDRDGRHLYFIASTDLGLASGWANTSSIGAEPSYAAYVTVLRAEDPSPFRPESDEEAPPSKAEADSAAVEVLIDFENMDRRTVALPVPVRNYAYVGAGPAGVVFLGEQVRNQPGLTLQRFSMKDRKADEFAVGVSRVAISADGEKMLYRSGDNWSVVGTGSPPERGSGRIDVELRAYIDPAEEWNQIFEEAWRQERDYFYDPNTHGADWDAVHARYAPLIPHVRHRADLTYVLDQVGGELSVGHSFVGGGDMPATDTVRVGLLGADLTVDGGRWRLERILTSESWNPTLRAPLDAPGLRVSEGDYILAIDGFELTDADDPFKLLDGTVDRQTVLRLNSRPSLEDSWTITVVPIRSEDGLRTRTWVEDNRRRVDELSDGRLAYVWVPNTSGAGVVSFDRYFFAQQDKLGAVIDERFNGGGNLDDYMVDLMNRNLRAAISNEAPGSAPFRLPAGLLGPKVLVINELAGSGGDYFPWAFRRQNIGPLIGTRTWGGLVRSAVHYQLIDAGYITSPANAVFDGVSDWVAENVGVPPDIEVVMDAQSVAAGRDPQLERAVDEALRMIDAAGTTTVTTPQFPNRARRPSR